MAPSRVAFSDVIDGWAAEGPLVHYRTHFDVLDQLTGGGPVFGTRWYVMGAPDACKTLFLSMLANVWSATGLIVGMLAVDEEPADLAQRFIQRMPMPNSTGFFQRVHCEEREEHVLALMRQATAEVNVVFYGPEWTIEGAAGDLAEFCKERNKRGALMVDSVQTVECESVRAEREVALREKITANAKAIRDVATKLRLIVVATSEMNRAAYSAVGRSEQNDMAAAKESGAIEYSARVMLALRVATEEEDCIEVKVIKNKHGRSFPAAEPFYLALDRARQTLLPRDAPEGAESVSLVEACATAVAKAGPAGIFTEGVRKSVKSGAAQVVAALHKAQANGLIRRTGAKSPWTLCDLDPDSDEFP